MLQALQSQTNSINSQKKFSVDDSRQNAATIVSLQKSAIQLAALLPNEPAVQYLKNGLLSGSITLEATTIPGVNNWIATCDKDTKGRESIKVNSELINSMLSKMIQSGTPAAVAKSDIARAIFSVLVHEAEHLRVGNQLTQKFNSNFPTFENEVHAHAVQFRIEQSLRDLGKPFPASIFKNAPASLGTLTDARFFPSPNQFVKAYLETSPLYERKPRALELNRLQFLTSLSELEGTILKDLPRLSDSHPLRPTIAKAAEEVAHLKKSLLSDKDFEEYQVFWRKIYLEDESAFRPFRSKFLDIQCSGLFSTDDAIKESAALMFASVVTPSDLNRTIRINSFKKVSGKEAIKIARDIILPTMNDDPLFLNDDIFRDSLDNLVANSVISKAQELSLYKRAWESILKLSIEEPKELKEYGFNPKFIKHLGTKLNKPENQIGELLKAIQ
jgi:hypothetical protein